MCAAPSSEFITKTIDDITGSTVKPCQVGVRDGTNTVLMARYYLDFIRGVAEYDASGNLVTSKSGFIGGCIIGSNNYYMHNRSRDWSVGSFMASNEVWFNDAGKNTLGIILNEIPTVLQETNIENFIIPTIQSRSAWHVNGTFGVEFSINMGVWQKQQVASQDKQNTITISNTNIADNFEFKQAVRIRLYHLNAEGIFTNTLRSFTVNAAPITMKYDDTYASYANNKPDSYTYYYTIRGLLMSTIYLDPLGNTQAPIGYYVTGGYWYMHAYSDTVDKNIITKFGKAESGKWPDGDPANPTTGYSTWNWYAYHAASQVGACSAIYSPVTTYRRNSDGKHFMNTTLTTPAPDGYYIEDALAKGWFHIQNQLLINSGAC